MPQSEEYSKNLKNDNDVIKLVGKIRYYINYIWRLCDLVLVKIFDVWSQYE